MPSRTRSNQAIAGSNGDELPEYASELAAFHRAFAAELKSIVDALPLRPTMRVLDVGCGDGMFLGLLAERLQGAGAAIGFDNNSAFLDLARRRMADLNPKCEVDFIYGDLSELGRRTDRWDFAWCAQSLYSLPDPVSTLKTMKTVLEPDGLVAVLENDTVHQLLLPWPPRLEIALRSAELLDLAQSTSHPAKFYVGRRLPAVFDAAGLEPLSFRTQCIDRQGPIDADLEQFLQGYFDRLLNRVRPFLERELLHDFSELIDATHERYLPRQRHFTLTWLNVLVVGRGR